MSPGRSSHRAESIAEKPAFRDAARERRCLVTASGFFEWTREGEARLPWWITRAVDVPMTFAGVWQTWGRDDPKATVAIVTTAANVEMSRLHDRMPVVLEAGDWSLWLGEEGHGVARLLAGSADGTFAYHRVGPAVNSKPAGRSGPDRAHCGLSGQKTAVHGPAQRVR